MEFITIEHKNGAITLPMHAVDYVIYNSINNSYRVFFKQMKDGTRLHDDVELNKEQYEKLLTQLVYTEIP